MGSVDRHVRRVRTGSQIVNRKDDNVQSTREALKVKQKSNRAEALADAEIESLLNSLTANSFSHVGQWGVAEPYTL